MSHAARPSTVQLSLFDAAPALSAPLPDGFDYEPQWLDAREEGELIALVRALPFEHATYKSYTARRRVVGYGGRFDYDTNRLMPAAPLADVLVPLRDRVARWAGVAPDALAHALVSEYAPGTPLGWHRDVPDFEEVFGVSLGGFATMRLRPYPPPARSTARRDGTIRLEVAPRSIYAMRGAARWAWQHCVVPVPALRWSITFRTRRAAGAAGRSPGLS